MRFSDERSKLPIKKVRIWCVEQDTEFRKLSKKLRISENSFYYWATYKMCVPVKHLRKICEYFGKDHKQYMPEKS